MYEVFVDECKAAGKRTQTIAALAQKLEAIGKELHKQGVYVFGGSGAGTIRFNDGNRRPLVLAHFGQGFDGGDGACDNSGPDGLMRGE